MSEQRPQLCTHCRKRLVLKSKKMSKEEYDVHTGRQIPPFVNVENWACPDREEGVASIHLSYRVYHDADGKTGHSGW